MRIGLDLRMIGGGSGISRYIYELFDALLMHDKSNEYVLFFNKLDDESRQFAKYGHKIVETHISHYSFGEQFRLPKLLKQENLDLMHFPHFNVPLAYNRPFVVTIHDLTHTKFPGKKKTHILHRLAYRMVIRHAVKKAVKIIAVSQSTKNEVMEYYRIAENKVRVIYEGIASAYKTMDKQQAWNYVSYRYKINKPYILYVGVWRRYKNLEALAQVFRRLKSKGHDLLLVLAGEIDPHYPEIKEKVTNIVQNQDLVILGRTSDQDLSYLYNAAKVFVLPSLAEGFGLTALEAAGCYTPVVCSDIPTLREVMGNGAAYFDPTNIDNMTDVLSELLSNDRKLSELAELSLARSKHFSWSKAGEQTVALYQSL